MYATNFFIIIYIIIVLLHIAILCTININNKSRISYLVHYFPSLTTLFSPFDPQAGRVEQVFQSWWTITKREIWKSMNSFPIDFPLTKSTNHLISCTKEKGWTKLYRPKVHFKLISYIHSEYLIFPIHILYPIFNNNFIISKNIHLNYNNN